MRVLQCIWRLSVGGAERQFVQLTSALIAAGADVHVVTVFPGQCDAGLAATGAATHRLRAMHRYDITLIPRMAMLMRRLAPDVVTTWLLQMDLVGGMAAKWTGRPWILCERSAPEYYQSGRIWRVRTRAGAHAGAVVANSEGGGRYWRDYIEAARIHVIPNIVPAEEIARTPVLSDGVSPNDDVILYAGRFSEEKNLDRLVEALARVLPGRAATAVFCGDGALRPDIERKAAALGIAGRTRFLGSVSNIFGWMKRASVVVGVSLFEGNPNTVLEAIACGVPVVVSDIAPYRALVNGDTAWLVDPRSVESMAEGIAAALGDRDAARARAERARAVVQGRSAHAVAERYLEVFADVARRERG